MEAFSLYMWVYKDMDSSVRGPMTNHSQYCVIHNAYIVNDTQYHGNLI